MFKLSQLFLLFSTLPLFCFASNPDDFSWVLDNQTNITFTRSPDMFCQNVSDANKDCSTKGDTTISANKPPETLSPGVYYSGTVQQGSSLDDFKMTASYSSSEEYVIRLVSPPVHRTFDFTVNYREESTGKPNNCDSHWHEYDNYSENPTGLITVTKKNGPYHGCFKTSQKGRYYLQIGPAFSPVNAILKITYPQKNNANQNQLFLNQLVATLNPDYIRYFDIANSLPITENADDNSIEGKILCDSTACQALL